MAQPPRPLAPSKVRVPAVAGLTRERLLLTLDRIWDHRCGLVLAPPGAGKTTALAQYARTVDVPVAWYRAEPTDGRAGVLLAYLSRALNTALGRPDNGPADLEKLVDDLDDWPGPAELLIIAYLHAYQGNEAEGE